MLSFVRTTIVHNMARCSPLWTEKKNAANSHPSNLVCCFCFFAFAILPAIRADLPRNLNIFMVILITMGKNKNKNIVTKQSIEI